MLVTQFAANLSDDRACADRGIKVNRQAVTTRGW
jgi:hypothetical protein